MRTKKAIAGLVSGAMLEVIATAPGSVKDLDPSEITEWVGAAIFLPRALQAGVNLFV